MNKLSIGAGAIGLIGIGLVVGLLVANPEKEAIIERVEREVPRERVTTIIKEKIVPVHPGEYKAEVECPKCPETDLGTVNAKLNALLDVAYGDWCDGPLGLKALTACLHRTQ